MLWLNAKSFLALGMTTATLKSFVETGAGVAGAAPQALNTIERASIRVTNHANFFIFFSLGMNLLM
jgi:hypothetical protein